MTEHKHNSQQDENTKSAIQTACDRLSALYSFDEGDSPESIAGKGPRPKQVVHALKTLVELIIPLRDEQELQDEESIGAWLQQKLNEAWLALLPEVERAIPYRWMGCAAQAEGAPERTDSHAAARLVLQNLLEQLPEIRSQIVDDLKAAYAGDPAALTYAEIKLAYPGVLAIVSHRIAHRLYSLDVPIVPRIMSEWTHSKTGVDIHPGAQIGKGFFIDHATGVVIGETSKIGDNVKLYQGVTLGARSFALDEDGNPIKHVQRHPTIEDNVVIYSQATILGGDTVIGEGSVIGGNVFLTESVPAGSVVLRSAEGPRIKSKLRPD